LGSKTKFGANKYVVVKNTAGVLERRQPQSNKNAKHSCEKHNLSTPDKRLHLISVKTEINIRESNFCTGERDFAHDWNTEVQTCFVTHKQKH
jgi:hypothetical protein